MIDQMAGIVGVDPGPLTARRLAVMVEAKDRQAWNHTAAWMSLLANIHRDKRKKGTPFTLADFHPYHRQARSGVPITRENIGMLKQVFGLEEGTEASGNGT